MAKNSAFSSYRTMGILALAAGAGSSFVLLFPKEPEVPAPPVSVVTAIPQTQAVQVNKSAKFALDEKPLALKTADTPPQQESGEEAPPPQADLDDEAPVETAGEKGDETGQQTDGMDNAVTEPLGEAERSVRTTPAKFEPPQPGSLKPPFRPEFDEALAPLMNYAIAETDLANVKEAFRLAGREEFTAARTLMARISDPAARKLVHWQILRASGVETPYSEIIRFREENPFWPSKTALNSSIEAGLLFSESRPERILAYFADKAPETGAGKAALGGALIATGKAIEGKALISEAWRRHVFDNDIEERIQTRLGTHLTKADHRARLYWLLAKDPKKKAGSIQKLRNKLQEDGTPLPVTTAAVPAKAKAAEKARQAKAKATQAKVKAAKAAADKKKAGNKAVTAAKPETNTAAKPVPGPAAVAAIPPAAVTAPTDVTRDSGYQLARVKDLRRKGKNEDVWAVMRSLPKSSVGRIDAVDWWEERRYQVRAALNNGHPKTAYEIASNHGPLEGEYLAEAGFLAGWLALRFLDQPKTAREHFATASKAGGLPKDKSRAAYWLGRAEAKLGNDAGADAAFRKAAEHNHTFYGQLARHSLGATIQQVEFREPHRTVPSDLKAFATKDYIRAIAIAKKADLTNLLPIFLFDLARNVTDPAEMAFISEFSLRAAQLPITVRFAKIAINRGFAVDAYAFPASLPNPQIPIEEAVERSLLHALTRQESEFNTAIVSPAGARGLMQLMPATAKMVAKNLNVKYDPKKLDDPAFNVMLGSAFLKQMVGNYDGSYIMALAAYNAGPGRVRQWVAKFGDPRSPKTDPIDWIERIPFTETRDYVHKIMESLQMYRAKFAESGPKAQLSLDVNRGRSRPSVMQAGAN